MKDFESLIPSFAELAIQYDMLTQEQLNEAYNFIKDKSALGESCSLESFLVSHKILTRYQINLINVLRDFMVIRKKSEHFGQIVVKKGYATDEDITFALANQKKLFREKKSRVMIGDILVESGVITREQQQEIAREYNISSREVESQNIEIQQKKNTDFTKQKHLSSEVMNSKKKEIEEHDGLLEIVISEDSMEAWVKIITYYSTSDTSASSTQPPIVITPSSIKYELKKKGVTNGVLNDAILQCYLDRKDHFFLVAVGDYYYSENPEYQFKSDKPVSETVIKKDKIIALLNTEKIMTTKKDVYGMVYEFITMLDSVPLGNAIPLNERARQLDFSLHPIFRYGKYVTISQDGMKVIAEHSGYPAVSIDRKLYVFPVVNILGDADSRFVPISPYASANISGVLNGTYSIDVGQLKAKEIRGAKLSSIGDITVEMGIIDSRIKTQGNVRAKYIYNSWIETFGDLIVEHEILDSTVIISGACNSPAGRVLASIIHAKKGVTLAGVGGYLTQPSEISVGSENHIVRQSMRIALEINNVRKKLDDLIEQKEGIEQQIKELFAKMVKLKIIHDNAKSKILKLNKEISVLDDKDKKEKNQPLMDATKKEMDAALESLKQHNQQKKNMEVSLNKTENSIIKIRPNVEFEIKQLEMDRNHFLKWAERLHTLSEIKVSGKIAEGTIVKGAFSSLEINEDIVNIKIFESIIEGVPETSKIQINSL